jgi:hypothetical protein
VDQRGIHTVQYLEESARPTPATSKAPTQTFNNDLILISQFVHYLYGPMLVCIYMCMCLCVCVCVYVCVCMCLCMGE